MIFLLSPAKSIQTEGSYPETKCNAPAFLKESELLVGKLKKLSSKKLVDLYDVSKEIAAVNHERFQNWHAPLEKTSNVRPCVFAFNGEVYRGLDALNQNLESLNYMNDHVRILSGLYGILKPFDLIYPYKLEMGTSFAVTPKTKNLYQFWGNKITDFINTEEDQFVINLASQEYFKAVNLAKLKAKVITIHFKEFKNGKYQILMTYAKHARGEMAKFAAHKALKSPEDLKLFDYLGYQYMDQLSSETDWVFAR